jgi:uncharacterized membrane protein YphA (DoxX/SURF4 family)
MSRLKWAVPTNQNLNLPQRDFWPVSQGSEHAPQGFWPLLNDGEGAVLCCFIFLLFLASTGGGPWSFDRLLRKQKSN